MRLLQTDFRLFFVGTLLLGLAFVISFPAAAADDAGTVTIYRDNWGVPYIYAATDADAAYGLGYAQAEDRLGDLFINIRTAMGTMAEAFGPDHIDTDYAMKMVKNPEYCREHWDEVPTELRTIGESFIAGVKRYMTENPERIPEWSLELEPWQLMAIGRAMILRWPLGGIQDEIKNTRNSNGFGSNQWSVAPSRSAEGCAILLTDPHLTWEGMAVFYEAHVEADLLDMHGFFLVGSPLLALGHNGNVGWAATTGGPDTADVYALKLNPANPAQYEYDGEWRNIELRFINIPVKGQDPVTRPAAYTHLGPFFAEPDFQKGVAYVGATPYFESGGLFEQFYRMCVAKNADEFYDALAMNAYMEQNIMFADRNGTIQYVRTGRVPIRPEGYDWSRAVPGHTSDTKWLGIHGIEDLVQVKNPPQGYMQNCNISPQNMMLDSPMTPDKYEDYIYNVSWDTMNTRGTRLIQLLSSDESITKEEAKAIAFDVYDVLAEPWQKALDTAVKTIGAERMKNPEFARAVELILGWDRQFLKQSQAAPIVRFWRDRCDKNVDLQKLLAGDQLSADDQRTLLVALDETLKAMRDQYGEREITWGDVNKVGRSGRYFPVDGAVFGSGKDQSRTLLNVKGEEEQEGSGVYIANNGSMSMVLMFFYPDGIESYTCIPWGQSADPVSPHHMDQGEKLYSQRQFKRVRQTRDDVIKHAESAKLLQTS